MLHDAFQVLKLFTGFSAAAFIDWKLTVIIATNTDITPPAVNIHQLMSVRYANDSNHLFVAHHARGDAINMAIATNLRKSPDNNATIRSMPAPNTFLIPIKKGYY